MIADFPPLLPLLHYCTCQVSIIYFGTHVILEQVTTLPYYICKRWKHSYTQALVEYEVCQVYTNLTLIAVNDTSFLHFSAAL